MLGKVVEIFIPNDDVDMIGFRVQVEDDVIDIIEKQNNVNALIYVNDLVNVYYDESNKYVIEKVLEDEE